MIVNLQIPWKRIFKDLRYPFLVIILYISLLSIFDYYFLLEPVHIPLPIITVPGTVIGLLLAFRTNSAYDRWWEARTIWGAIVNDSRTWVRQLLTFINDKGSNLDRPQFTRKLSYRQIAWNYALAIHLRNKTDYLSIRDYITESEWESIKDKNNLPNALLYEQGKGIRTAFRNQWIDSYQLIELDQTLTRLTDAMGKCERIKNTVFPSSYSLLVDILIYLFIVFLPFALVEMSGYILIPTTLSLAFSFLVIDRIAIYMQDPFECLPSDTPMTALSRTIEINIKQELGEKDIPSPMEPVNGVLM